jgi:hypothetical protein
MWCDAVWYERKLPKFERNMLPLSSGHQQKTDLASPSETSANASRRYITEDKNLRPCLCSSLRTSFSKIYQSGMLGCVRM